MGRLTSDVEKAIDEAIKLVIDGRDFFKKAADITDNKLGKKMFLKLATEEEKHLDEFVRLISSIMKDEEWRKQIKVEDLQQKSPVVQKLVSRIESRKGKDEIEAVRIGMELNNKAIEFFEEMAEKADDPLAREIFSKICSEEKFYYDLLQAQLDSLTNSGFWLDSAEFEV